ncbi:hypothetical protein [Microcystis sp. M158S2]|uniref:hypothetical protein n=1 Tax=Microcystis sp. M158S2 TaxID=2771152 RepID=UPI00258FF0BD|nr:hypothetical protein [Microcystis sp. M158S2]MCA2734529.1 hypothetical protein [Microcystis sp. M158S2]
MFLTAYASVRIDSISADGGGDIVINVNEYLSVTGTLAIDWGYYSIFTNSGIKSGKFTLFASDNI